MVRYSKWRELADRERRKNRFETALRVSAASVFGVAVGAFCCYVGIPVYFFLGKLIENALILRRVNRLRDDPAPYAQYACRIILSFEGTAYGWDEGLLCFIGGIMLFEGRQTSFSVPRTYADPNRDFAEYSRSLRQGFGFAFECPQGKCDASIRPISASEIADDYSAWLSFPVETEGSTVLPPCQPQEEAWRRVSRLKSSVYWIFIVGGTLATAALLIHSVLAALVAFVFWLPGLLLALGTERKKRKLLSLFRPPGELPNRERPD